MSVTLDPTDTRWYFSPYNWDSDGAGALQSNNVRASSTYAQSNTPGAYFRAVFSGTSCTLTVVTTMLSGVSAGNCPALQWSIDGGATTRSQLSSGTTTVTLATGLANTSHTLTCYYVGVAQNANDRWTTPTMVVRVTGLTTDTSFSAPTLKPRRLLLFGDSNTEGQEALAAGGTVAGQDASLTYAQVLASALSAEIGVIGYSSQGLARPGVQNVPACKDAWSYYSSGRSRLVSSLFSPAPDMILCNHGINDANNGYDVTTPVQTVIAAWRAASSSTTPIVFVVPWTGQAASQLSAGVTAAGDAHAYYVSTGVTTYSSQNIYHLTTAGHAAYAADIRPLIAGYLPALRRGGSIFAGVVR